MDIYFFSIVGFIITVATAYLALSDKHTDFKRNLKEGEKPKPKSYRTIFAIAVLSAVMTLYLNIDSKKKQIKSAENASELSDSLFRISNDLTESQKLNTKILLEQKDSTNRIIKAQDELIESQGKLSVANDKIQGLQHELFDYLTGGTSFPIAGLQYIGDSEFSITVYNQGDFKLTGISMEFLNLGLFANLVKSRAGGADSSNGISTDLINKNFIIPFVNARDSYHLPEKYKVASLTNPMHIFILTISPNGRFSQHVLLKYKYDKWYSATIVFKDPPIDYMQNKAVGKKKILHQYIANGYLDKGEDSTSIFNINFR
jgi:hypothetical protein